MQISDVEMKEPFYLVFGYDEDIVEIVLSTSALLDYVEKSKLNVKYVPSGNSGIGEPWLELDPKEVVTNPLEYLISNLHFVCRNYLQVELGLDVKFTKDYGK